MTDARESLAQRIRHLLTAHDDVRELSMFGGLSFMVDGRMAVAARGDGSLLVRTAQERHEELLTRGAEPARMGAGRPMGEAWLTVPPARIADDGQLAFWIAVGRESRADH
jgi:TfoX/Sxy family transcriptional regulator of competence genes